MHRRDSKEERRYYGVKIGKSFSCFSPLPLQNPSDLISECTYCVLKVSRVRRRKFHFYAIIYASNTSLFLFLTRFSHEMYVNSSSFRCSVTLLLYVVQRRETAQGSVPCWVVVVSRILLHFLNHFILKRKKEKKKAFWRKNSRNMKQSHQNQFGNSYKDFYALSRAVCLACTTISYHS